LPFSGSGYFREHDLFQLRVEDIIVNPHADFLDVAVKLGVAERQEKAKTGSRQGARLDWSGTAVMLIDRIAKKGPSEKLFNTTGQRYREAWLAAVAEMQSWPDCAGLKVGPPHSARHTGASRDLSEGYRSLWQVQRRGRWSSEKSVLRYAKSHAWTEAQARTPAAVREIGGAYLKTLRGERPPVAPE
jgi:integrase